MQGLTHFLSVQTVGNVAQDQKLGILAGTYIGAGSAASLIATGRPKIHHVWMNLSRPNFSAGTLNARIIPIPCTASGTPGSFYPVIFRAAATNKNITLNGTSATFIWRALVE